MGADWTPGQEGEGPKSKRIRCWQTYLIRAGPGGAPDSWAGHCCSCYLALYFLQIMIEFCPGGAVDAIMLGESFWFFFLPL